MDSFSDMAPDAATLDTPARKSDIRYKTTYDAFIKWQDANGITEFGEDVMLTYFTEAAKIYKSSTLWSMYSMLNSTLSRHKNVDISTHSQLLAFLKQKSVGFESKKYKAFSAEEINRFLVEAPDEHYLAMKVQSFSCLFHCI